MGADADMSVGGTAEAGIRAVLAALVEAWNEHDAQSFSMVFAEDADFTNVRGMGARGRAEIAKFHVPVFATAARVSQLKILDSRIRFIKPDVAAVDARWEMTGARTPDGNEIPLRKGLMIFLMTREGDPWLIRVMHNMDLSVTP
jgi:uncharacterized protein (TIGR02246 family)